MTRTYKKRLGARTYLNYSSETVEKAVSLVRNNTHSIREASRIFCIPFGTLFNKVNGLHLRKNGGQTILSQLEENDLCETIRFTGEWGFPLKSSNVKQLIKNYLDEKNMNTRFANNLPGDDWISGYMKRMKTRLASRMSQNIKRNRARVTPDIISAYFENLAKTVSNIPAENIINYDETNFTDDPESSKVIVKRGQKHVENVMDHSKSAYSVMFAGSADGKMLPPYVIYAAVHLYPTWTEGGPKGTRYNRTKSGIFNR